MCILSGSIAVHCGMGCAGLRAGSGKKAVVCGMNACSKGLVVGSGRLPESASDTSCTLCASWLFSHLISLSFACFVVPCLNFSHSTLVHWIRSQKSWCACSPSLEQALLCHPVLRNFSSGLYFKPLWDDEKMKSSYQQCPQSHDSINICGSWPDFMSRFPPADHWSTKRAGSSGSTNPNKDMR